MVLGDPFLLFHEVLVHDRDLSGWAAEADEAELQPVSRRFAERNVVLGHW
jgi:hypothetical protein